MIHINYTVKEGDTLWGLRRQFGASIDEMARLNNIKNPDLIRIGQTLRIPVVKVLAIDGKKLIEDIRSCARTHVLRKHTNEAKSGYGANAINRVFNWWNGGSGEIADPSTNFTAYRAEAQQVEDRYINELKNVVSRRSPRELERWCDEKKRIFKQERAEIKNIHDRILAHNARELHASQKALENVVFIKSAADISVSILGVVTIPGAATFAQFGIGQFYGIACALADGFNTADFVVYTASTGRDIADTALKLVADESIVIAKGAVKLAGENASPAALANQALVRAQDLKRISNVAASVPVKLLVVGVTVANVWRNYRNSIKG